MWFKEVLVGFGIQQSRRYALVELQETFFWIFLTNEEYQYIVLKMQQTTADAHHLNAATVLSLQ